MKHDWNIGFEIPIRSGVIGNVVTSPVLRGRVAASIEIEHNVLRFLIAENGDSAKAIARATETVWTMLEEQELTGEVRRAWFGPDHIDCTQTVAELEALRQALISAEGI